MENFFYLVIGMLLMYLILQKPLRFEVHHVHEDVQKLKDKEELRQLEKEMLEKNPKEDALYDQVDEIVKDIDDVMGGSDR